MPTFPSKEWCEEAIRLVNADPECVEAGRGWDADFGAVVLSEPGKLSRHFVVHLVPKEGRIAKWKVLMDPDDLEEIEPAYLARAPFSVWKGLIDGTLDPVIDRIFPVAGIGDAMAYLESGHAKGKVVVRMAD